jgi:hypothetical protein
MKRHQVLNHQRFVGRDVLATVRPPATFDAICSAQRAMTPDRTVTAGRRSAPSTSAVRRDSGSRRVMICSISDRAALNVTFGRLTDQYARRCSGGGIHVVDGETQSSRISSPAGSTSLP